MPDAGECKYITLKDLKDVGLMDSSIKDTRTNEEISDELKIKITGTLSKHETLILNYEVDPGSVDGCVSAIAPELNPQGTYLMINSSASSADTYFLGQEKIKRNQVESITVTHTNKIPSNAIESWDVSEVQDRSVIAWYTDKNNNNLYELYIGGEGGVKANPDSSYLFQYFSNATTIEVNYLDTSNVMEMRAMFQMGLNDGNGEVINIIGLNKFNTSKVTNMRHMFNGCGKLEKLDISNFNTSKVTDISSMFEYCLSLKSLDLSKWDVSNLKDLTRTFSYCRSLTKLDLSNFNTSKVTNMYYTFLECISLTSLDVSSFDTSNVTNMFGTFRSCSSLTNIDLSNFDTSQVAYMQQMFSGCTNLVTIDLRKADFINVTTYPSMFYNCNKLTTIYVKDTNAQTFINERLADAKKTGVTVRIV